MPGQRRFDGLQDGASDAAPARLGITNMLLTSALPSAWRCKAPQPTAIPPARATNSVTSGVA